MKNETKKIKRNTPRFIFVLSIIQTATVIGGGDPRLNKTVKDVVAACRDNNSFTLSAVEGGYEISGSSCTWFCTN